MVALVVHRPKRGFTLVEILVALGMFGVVAAATLKLTIRARRTYGEQLDRLALQAESRIGIAIVEGELRGLDATDPAGSDLIAIEPNSVVYNAMRVLAFLCRPAPADAATIFVWRDPIYGQRPFDVSNDSLLLYAGGGRWLRADLTNVAPGRPCPDDSEGLALSLADDVGVPLATGTPVRGFEGARLHLYSSDGYWLGSNRRYKNGQWTRTQPLVGPLARQGFRLDYLSAIGLTQSIGSVSGIGVRLIVRAPGSGIEDTVATTISLRNNEVAR